MSFWSNWSDGTKWLMGIFGALIVTALIALAAPKKEPPAFQPEPSGTKSNPGPTSSPSLAPNLDTSPPPKRTVIASIPLPIPSTPPASVEKTTAATPATHQELIREVTTQEFNFKFSGCTRAGSNVTCDLLVTDLVGDRNFYIDSGQITDSDGNVYEAARFYLGAESGPFLVNSTLPVGIATKAALDFKSVRSGTLLIEALELRGHARDKARSRVVVRFPKIPL